MTLCEIDISRMYSMHKKCLIISKDSTVTLSEIHTSKMYNRLYDSMSRDGTDTPYI